MQDVSVFSFPPFTRNSLTRCALLLTLSDLHIAKSAQMNSYSLHVSKRSFFGTGLINRVK